MKKFCDILSTIYAIGILICLLAGGLSLVGYVIAMFIGGEMATTLCSFIFKSYLTWVIKFTCIFAGIGLLSMYLSKQKSLTLKSQNNENEQK